MAMAVTDPRILLDAMGTMLGEYGDIKGPHEVVAVISLMKDAEKLLSRYTFLNILRATVELASENSVALETVNQFVKDGGCTILNKWLADAKGWENLPLILEVLEILEAMPITIEALKQGNIGKLVKQLTKSEENDIKELASSLLNKWMILVKGKPKKSKKSEEKTEDPNTAGSPTMKRARDSAPASKTNQPPEKKSKSLEEAMNNVTSVAKPPPKAKVIPALPKPVVMESSGFMNALIQQTAPVPAVKKRKKVSTPPSPKQTYAGPLEEILQKQAQTHMQEDETDKGSKQKEKQDDNEKEEEKETGNSDSQESSQEGSIQSKSTEEGPTDLEKSNTDLPEPANAEPTDAASPSEGTVEESTEGKEKPEEKEGDVEVIESEASISDVKNEGEEDVSKKKKKKKKSITWAEDDKLLVYHYYEPDDEERVNVQHVVNFHDAQHQEAIRERQRVEQAKRLSEDKMMEKLIWYRPRPSQVAELMIRGEKSEEKFHQKDRESKILAHLFFSKSSLPTTPDEPEPDANTSSTSSQPLVIPHDEKGTIYPPSKGATVTQPPIEVPHVVDAAGVSLPPALAALLANANIKGPGSSPSSSAGGNNPALSNVDVQVLLKKLMGSQEQGEQGTLEDAAERLKLELNNPRFPSPLMSQQLRISGRVPEGPRGMPLEPRGPPEYRPRGLLRTPGPPEHPRFPGPHRGGPPRGRFHPPGGPRLVHPMPGQRMPGPGMGRGGMGPNRFPGPDDNRDSGEEFYNDQDYYNFNDGENLEGLGRGMPPRGRGGRGRGRGRPIMCRHFMSPRGCLRGNLCPFIHPGVNGPPV